MKRDCGQGELIPIKYVVVSCYGESDDETESSFDSLELALKNFEIQVENRKNVKCSNVRLYVKDKQNYMNCVKSWMLDFNAVTSVTDRLSEL